MTLPTEPTIIAATAAVTVLVLGWFASKILATSELVRDIHRDITNPRTGLDAVWRKLDDVVDRLTQVEHTVSSLVPPDA